MNKALTPLQEDYVKLARTWSDYYLKNQTQFGVMLTSGTIVFSAFKSAYTLLVASGQVKDISELIVKEKWELMDKAKAWAPLADQNQLIEFCKCIHVLNFLIKQKATAQTVA